MANTSKICFRPNVFFGGMTSIIIFIIAIIVAIVAGAIYYIPKYTTQQSIFQQQLLSEAKKSSQQSPVIIREQQQRGSDRSYPTGTYVPREADFGNFVNVGYIFNTDGRFPLYMNRLGGKFYYFTRDDSRNNIKITIGNAEFGLKDEYFDGDSVSVPELSSTPFAIKIYENKGNIYKPFPIVF